MAKVPPGPAVWDEETRTFTGVHLGMLPGIVAVPRLLITIEREGGKVTERAVELEGERIRVGSNRSNELVLSDRSVSRFHCMLSLNRNTWSLTDTDSLNGTVLSGVRIRDAILPSGECQILIGNSVLRVTQLTPE